MVVDDSAIVRGVVCRILQSDPDIEVVKSAANGQAALNAVKEQDIDVILLDVEMPVMDGLTALPLLIKAAPNTRIIMNSTLTRRNAAVTIRALSQGAADFVAKPEAKSGLSSSEEFASEIIRKVKALAGAARRPATLPRPTLATKPTVATPKKGLYGDAQIILRNSPIPPRLGVLAIGSSTGGPQALLTLFEGFKHTPALPIMITQHMPPTFTAIMAEQIEKTSGIPSGEAKEGETVKPGHVYVAPGNYHMTVVKEDGQPVIRLNQGPPENFCRPAVDPMLRSLVEVYGGRTLVVILTGMGHDGLQGCQSIVEKGGLVLAQDEASSVVWGMPGAVATVGVCREILPIDRIGPRLAKLLKDQGL